MNGCLIIGTMDGANVEIVEEIGKENEFIFGALVDEIDNLMKNMINTEPEQYLGPELWEVLNAISSGMFGDRENLTHLVDSIRNKNDYYLVGADFQSYI